jgi:hypothetical protein
MVIGQQAPYPHPDGVDRVGHIAGLQPCPVHEHGSCVRVVVDWADGRRTVHHETEPGVDVAPAEPPQAGSPQRAGVLGRPGVPEPGQDQAREADPNPAAAPATARRIHNPDQPGGLAHQPRVAPIRCTDDLIQPAMFDSDTELDEFLADLHVRRRGMSTTRKQLRAQLTESHDPNSPPWREDRVELVDPNTGELVCRLAYQDAVVLAFEIEQASAQVHAAQWLRETLTRHNRKP